MKKRVFYITESQKEEIYRLIKEDSSNIAGIPDTKPNVENNDEDDFDVEYDGNDEEDELLPDLEEE